jgi:hypothetical protein
MNAEATPIITHVGMCTQRPFPRMRATESRRPMLDRQSKALHTAAPCRYVFHARERCWSARPPRSRTEQAFRLICPVDYEKIDRCFGPCQNDVHSLASPHVGMGDHGWPAKFLPEATATRASERFRTMHFSLRIATRYWDIYTVRWFHAAIFNVIWTRLYSCHTYYYRSHFCRNSLLWLCYVSAPPQAPRV